MDAVFKASWDAMEEYAKMTKDIYLTKEKSKFVEECRTLYKNFKKEYMDDETQVLDRHKVGAIFSIVASKGSYIGYKQKINEKEEFFLGKYNVPIVIALSFIEQEMNEDLHELRLIKRRKNYDLYIPTPTSCKTKYIDSLARIMTYEEDNNVDDLLRVIELANIFFLIEECTLLKHKVDIDKWTIEKLKNHNI